MHGGVVADGDPLAHDDRPFVAHAVKHGAVLHVGVGAQPDRVHIAAQHGIHPDAGVLPEGDVAKHLGGDVDVARGGDDRRVAEVSADHDFSVLLVSSR